MFKKIWNKLTYGQKQTVVDVVVITIIGLLAGTAAAIFIDLVFC